MAHIGGRAWRVDLEGTFKPGWLGNLGAALAGRAIGIERGRAEGDPLGRWTASLDLECPPAITPETVDFVALADDHRRVSAWRLFDCDYVDVRSVPEHRGSLLVDVQGADRVGFLAALLDRLALLALFPTALTIETSFGRVNDRLWLKAAGFRAPDLEVRQHLVKHLRP